MKFKYPEGATPLDPNESTGLIPDHITTQADLNEWEQANILEAETWLMTHFIYHLLPIGYNIPTWGYGTSNNGKSSGNILNVERLLSIDFIQQVHKKMFDKTWRWAGKFRRSDKNIGVDWLIIPVKIKELADDIIYQITHHTYEIDEIAARLHHRLVAIHPFSNGNGRHSRCITDIFLRIHNQPLFSWGQKNFYDSSPVREKYISALRSADKYDYHELLIFVRQ